MGQNTQRHARAGAIAAVAFGAASLLSIAPAGAATLPTLRRVDIHGYGMALANTHGYTLYVLSAEKGGKLVCKGACLAVWPAVVVPAAAKSVSLGPGIKGKIGFIRRSAKTKQVTYNGYPLYTFKADTKPAEDHGEGINHFGGTWYMVRATATTPAATPYMPVKAHTTAVHKASGGSSGKGW